MFDYRTQYSNKCITAEQALELVKSNDVITVGMASAEPGSLKGGGAPGVGGRMTPAQGAGGNAAGGSN